MLSVGKFAERHGVHVSTIRRWEKAGKVQFTRTKGGHKRYFISPSEERKHTKRILYSRVSSGKQKDDLERQKDFLRTCAKGNFEEISDIASGLNFKRSGLRKILEAAAKGDVSEVIVASRDRLARYGSELIEWVLKQHGKTLVVLNDNPEATNEQRLSEDLMAIIQVYCCRWNGQRRYTKAKGPETATKAIKGAVEDH